METVAIAVAITNTSTTATVTDAVSLLATVIGDLNIAGHSCAPATAPLLPLPEHPAAIQYWLRIANAKAHTSVAEDHVKRPSATTSFSRETLEEMKEAAQALDFVKLGIPAELVAEGEQARKRLHKALNRLQEQRRRSSIV